MLLVSIHPFHLPLSLRKVAAMCLVTLMLLLTVSAVNAGVQVRPSVVVRLTDLPPDSRIYVDGRRTFTRNGNLLLSPGEHVIQVESFRTPPPAAKSQAERFFPDRDFQEPQRPHKPPPPAGLMVFRICVSAVPGASQTVAVRPVPVYPTTAAYAPLLGAIGPPGPAGPPGRPADTARPLGPARAREVLQEALGARLHDLQILCDEIEREQFRQNAIAAPLTVLWYSPKGEPATIVPAEGPLGPQGPPGPAGIPGDVRRIKDDKQEFVLNRVTNELKLDELRRHLVALRQRVRERSAPPATLRRLESIPIYTETWRKLLDSAYPRHNPELRSYQPVGVELRGPVPPRGPAGPAGGDGALASPGEPPAPDVTLPAGDVDLVVGELVADTANSEKLKQLQARLAQLTALAVEAEAKLARTPRCDGK